MSISPKSNQAINRALDNVASIVNPAQIGKNRSVTSDNEADGSEQQPVSQEDFINIINEAEARANIIRKCGIGNSNVWAWWVLLFFILGIIILVLIIIAHWYPNIFDCNNPDSCNLSKSFVDSLKSCKYVGMQ